MEDEESRAIREEVVRLLEQEASGGSEGDKGTVLLSHESDETREPSPCPAQAEPASEPELLAAVLDDVRAQSAAGKLVEPTRWSAIGLVPADRDAEEWEMLVYEFLGEHAGKERAAAPAEPARTATCAVGVPRAFRPAEPKEEPAVEPELETGVESDVELGPESKADVEPAPEPPASAVPCDDIAVLVGARSYYLYSRDHMTDAFARWAFLASEDDRVATFAECVRQESRTYPRPMEAAAFANDPFGYTLDEVAELWEAVRASGAYPDLETTSASNGDVYYFSTNHLSPAYAQSLAEWNSVERSQYL